MYIYIYIYIYACMYAIYNLAFTDKTKLSLKSRSRYKKKIYNDFLKNNKKSHWLQVSGSKLLRELLGNIKMPTGFFRQNLQIQV